MRITAQSMDAVIPASDISKTAETTNSPKSEVTAKSVARQVIEEVNFNGEEQEITKDKLQNVVDTVNEFLQVNHNASKFVLHDGLDRYFVQVVNTQTEEVVKEIPPKKILDAFYEMQKLLGMIVDEKI
ncbi:flagellar protein FlaG [Lysinibacillus capsici]|uniref:flagellar protein FlaG n=1 Tax=Lysinibacillus capsici TaxID=2115968 RepID=UPI002E225C87|nr:flagellar protein FlaG [Lysinibacillus capsici]